MRPRRIAALLGIALAAFATGYLARGERGSTQGVAADPPLTDSDLRVSVKAGADSLDKLLALPYVDATFDPKANLSGVVLHQSARAQPGFNFYHSRTRREAYLLDMDGNLLHQWSLPGVAPWHHVELLLNGDVLVVEKRESILRLDKDSRLLWRHETRAHHDIWVGEDRIYTLTRRARAIPEVHPAIDTLEDTLTILSLDGKELEVVSLFDLLAGSPYRWLLHSVAHLPAETLVDKPSQALDVLHTNHVEVFDGSLADRSALFRRGNILLSIRNINTILILDADSHEILWLWGPTNIVLQHHPTLLSNGNILLFDNRRKKSRVIEVDPVAQSIVWQYSHEDFFSRTRGSAQRLPNANTLITESDSGYAFEVTPQGEEVWRFANPDVTAQGERSTIWRMTRIDPSSLTFDLQKPSRQ